MHVVNHIRALQGRLDEPRQLEQYLACQLLQSRQRRFLTSASAVAEVIRALAPTGDLLYQGALALAGLRPPGALPVLIQCPVRRLPLICSDPVVK